ncbi:unnamed protein product, partial [Caretta caretta]
TGCSQKGDCPRVLTDFMGSSSRASPRDSVTTGGSGGMYCTPWTALPAEGHCNPVQKERVDFGKFTKAELIVQLEEDDRSKEQIPDPNWGYSRIWEQLEREPGIAKTPVPDQTGVFTIGFPIGGSRRTGLERSLREQEDRGRQREPEKELQKQQQDELAVVGRRGLGDLPGGGSLGKGTSLKGGSDADLVVFLSCFKGYSDQETIRAAIIKEIKRMLEKCQQQKQFEVSIKQSRWPNPRVLSFMMSSKMLDESIEFDMLPACNALSSGAKPDSQVYKELIHSYSQGGRVLYLLH